MASARSPIPLVTVPSHWTAEELRKARLGVKASMAYGAILGIGLLAGLPMAKQPALLIMPGLIALMALVGNVLLMRWTGKATIAGRMLVFELVAGITMQSVMNGGATIHGLETTAGPWLIVVPLLATMLVGGRFGFVAAGLCAAQAIAMWSLFKLGTALPPARLDEALTSSVWSTCMAIAFLLAAAIINENMRKAALADVQKALEALKASNAQREAIAIELQGAQRLEAVGRLSAGVAHEINTPVQFVSDSVHFVSDAVADLTTLHDRMRLLVATAAMPEVDAAELELDYAYLAQEIPGALKRSLEGLERVASIVKAMKSFARADQNTKAPINLNEAIESTLTVSRGEYKFVADVNTAFGELPLVVCHAGQINQVVLNLICNAAHAIADQVKGSDKKGRIGVTTSREGDEVVIAISDTGGGIPEAVQSRVFDPFFTTKEVGRGSGQGLSISRSLVLEHQGRLSFETVVGVGTTFFVRLPLVAADASAA